MQEVSADWAIAVLESSKDDPVLHLRHLGTSEDRQRICRGAAPRGIPRPSHTFTDRTRFKDVRRTTRGYDDGLGTEHVEIPCTNVETDGPSDPVELRLVHQQVGHHDAVVDL